MPSPGNQFFSSELGDIEDYFVTDYEIIDQYVGDQLWIWGQNTSGSLGINNTNATTVRSTPVTTFAGGATWKHVDSGTYSIIALKTDGTLWSWGDNLTGQLGINNQVEKYTPVTTFAGGTNWKEISCGDYNSGAIKTDGTLWLFGGGSNQNKGQLGNNSTVDRFTPVTTFAGGTDWKQVSCGHHTAAIKTDGTLWTWGPNASGQLGINNTTDRSTPVTTFLGGNNWKSVSCSDSHTAAIKTDGTLWVWGRNVFGGLGINDSTNKSTPVTTFSGGTNWKFINSGYGVTAAIKTDGTLWVWGRNSYGQLGINSFSDKNTPVTTFAGGTNWKSVSNKYPTTLAIKTDGTLWVWGTQTTTGALGINNTNSRLTPVTTFAGGTNWKMGSSSGVSSVAIKSGLNVDLS